MISISPVPVGLEQIIQVYGNPDEDDDHVLDPQFMKDNLTIVELPFPMRLSWRPSVVVGRAQCHKAIAGSLVDALKEILDTVGIGQLLARGWDRWGGCFNFRLMRGYPALSVHSWGCAVDLNPDLGRFGHREDVTTYPAVIREAFLKRGWDWGGAWPEKYSADAMHFQACRGY